MHAIISVIHHKFYDEIERYPLGLRYCLGGIHCMSVRIEVYDINNGSMDRQVLVIGLQYHNHKLHTLYQLVEIGDGYRLVERKDRYFRGFEGE